MRTHYRTHGARLRTHAGLVLDGLTYWRRQYDDDGQPLCYCPECEE